MIHETAIVETGAQVGADSHVWHHAHLREGCRVGTGCTLGKNVFVDAGVHIGNRVKIQNNVSVYRGVTLEDDVFVGPSAVFTNDRFPRADNDTWRVVETTVRRGASIGANATILPGLEVGSWAMVAAGAVVTKSVSAHELVVGNPARRAGWVCRCGEIADKTSGDLKSPLHCPSCGESIP